MAEQPTNSGELLHIEDRVWVLVAPTGVANYDFDFRLFFTSKHPWQRPERIEAVARVGAMDDYEGRYQELAREGIHLVHSPGEYLLCTELPQWYPLLVDLTPKSVWYEKPPSAAEAGDAVGWPMFVKGARQTSRHQRKLSIIEGPAEFDEAMEAFSRDAILHWQGIVCREYVPLRLVEDAVPGRIPSSFEFRTFWWRGQLVGCGRYWWEGRPYELNNAEREQAIAKAGEAAKRVKARFLVVDVAQAADGRWIVIECNDGQESGYAGVGAVGMWRRVIDLENQSWGVPG